MKEIEYCQHIAANALDSSNQVKEIKRLLPAEHMPTEVFTCLSYIESANTLISTFANEWYQFSTTDELTKLKTLRYFNEVLEPKLRDMPDVGCLFIDIDRFKNYNDDYGHPQGNHAICLVAEVIKEQAEPNFSFRYGGEEFVALFAYANATADSLAEKGERIRKSVAGMIIKPHSLEQILLKMKEKKVYDDKLLPYLYRFFEASVGPDDYYQAVFYDIITPMVFERIMPEKMSRVYDYIRNMQRVTVSIGGAKRHAGEAIDELLTRADRALYRAKEAGRNGVKISDG